VFQELLQSLVESGKIKARTKWKEVYSSFANEERYLNMLGNPGSNPLELFWDLVDTLDQKLDAKIGVAERAMLAYNTRMYPNGFDNGGPSHGINPFVVGPETNEGGFIGIVKGNLGDSEKPLSDEDLHLVFETVRTIAGDVSSP